MSYIQPKTKVYYIDLKRNKIIETFVTAVNTNYMDGIINKPMFPPIKHLISYDYEIKYIKGIVKEGEDIFTDKKIAELVLKRYGNDRG